MCTLLKNNGLIEAWGGVKPVNYIMANMPKFPQKFFYFQHYLRLFFLGVRRAIAQTKPGA